MRKEIIVILANVILGLLVCLAQTATANAQGFGNLNKFEAALNGGATIVLGRKLNEATEYDLLVDVVNRDPALKDQLLNDPNFVAGVKTVKLLLADKKSSALRAEVINRVFQEVHGRNSTALEQAAYDAQMKQQKKWYAVILTSERDRLQKDSKERTAMLNRVYNNAMGRDANAADLKYWLPRYEHYTQVLAAARDWLYSPNGAKDLVETVTRCLNVRTGKNPNEELVKKTMTIASNDRMLFIEMLKSGIGK